MDRNRRGICLVGVVRIAGTVALVAGLLLGVVGAPAAQASVKLPRAAAAAGLSAVDWAQLTELLASHGAAGDQFGYSLAISSDTIGVGAPYHNSLVGAAYAFQVPTPPEPPPRPSASAPMWRR
ncbi:MAG TPA: FG-GAP repeat protein [Anaerolineae bacterium]|nr:FG-GAP repeat protein [Anaerolineae bacterium]HOQ99103.1 FG-GAP repeat protein [Anaerolineae bacterium]HPL29498.1 FG-GAP repeat protein [Anaerolineae bacterium]